MSKRAPLKQEKGPSGSYQEAMDFLKTIGTQIGLSNHVVEFVSGKPVLVLTWLGADPSLPSVLLNSHYGRWYSIILLTMNKM